MLEKEGMLVLGAIIIGVVFFTILFVILRFTVIEKAKCDNLFKELQIKNEYLHNLLNKTDFVLIERIAEISKTNLMYTQIYSEAYQKYLNITQNEEIKCDEVVKNIITLFEKRDYKNFRIYYKQATPILATYENSVNELNNYLIDVVKPEEEAKLKCLTLKDHFRAIKEKYAQRIMEVKLCEETFQSIFGKVQEKFEEFEDLVEKAEYGEADDMLPELRKVLTLCDTYLDVLPSLILRCTETIPQKLEETTKRYNDLISRDFQLNNTDFMILSDFIKENLVLIENDIKKLALKNVQEKLNSLDDRLFEVNDFFNREEEAKRYFDENSERVHAAYDLAKADFTKAKKSMPKYRTYYLINQEHEKELMSIQYDLDQVDQDKRRLDTYIHSASKSPYSFLIVKMDELDEHVKKFNERFAEYKKYLVSLKVDTEKNFSEINRVFDKLKSTELDLRNFLNEEYALRYKDVINESYSKIDSIYYILEKKPIDVDTANQLVNELVETTNVLFKTINDEKNIKDEALSEIFFLNRDRIKFADVNLQLNNAEQLFLDGEFARCLQMIEEIKRRNLERETE